LVGGEQFALTDLASAISSRAQRGKAAAIIALNCLIACNLFKLEPNSRPIKQDPLKKSGLNLSVALFPYSVALVVSVLGLVGPKDNLS